MPKKIKRRDFLKATAVGGAGFALGMTPFQIKTKGDIDRFYNRSIAVSYTHLTLPTNREV